MLGISIQLFFLLSTYSFGILCHGLITNELNVMRWDFLCNMFVFLVGFIWFIITLFTGKLMITLFFILVIFNLFATNHWWKPTKIFFSFHTYFNVLASFVRKGITLHDFISTPLYMRLFFCNGKSCQHHLICHVLTLYY